MEGLAGHLCLATQKEGLLGSNQPHAASAPENSNAQAAPPTAAPERLLTVTFKLVADRIFLVISFLASMVAAVQTRSSLKRKAEHPQDPCHSGAPPQQQGSDLC